MNASDKRQIELFGQIDDEVANRVIAQLLFFQMEAPGIPVTIRIDSPGGSVTASLAIIDTMEFVKMPVYTHCHGDAAGMALLILASGRKGHRSALSDASFQMARTTLGSAASKDPKTREFFERMQRRLLALYAKGSGRTEDEISAKMDDQTCFSPAGLLAYGLIDRIDP